MPSLTITWGGILDARTCRKCIDLIQTKAAWTFQTEKDPFPSVLSHPKWGLVWDCNRDQSMAHGGSRHHCRCGLTWVTDDIDLEQAIEKAKQRVAELERILEATQK